ncbi:hypothetical protein ACFWZ2_39020 [Streptomyces sp. NPDC059002]|uniref:hypothetical protein n=1 Tax=Streptomyces sp. NPDC059002 TaxID=3346690 RepID=UPI00369047C2
MRTAPLRNATLALAATAALAFSLTACNDGEGTKDSGAASSSSTSTSKESTAPAPKGSSDSGSSGSTGSGESSSSDSGVVGSDSGGAGDDTGAKGECINTGTEGCFTGTLSYLAEYKMMVDNQEFEVGDDTQIRGAAAICGGSDGSVTADNNVGTTACTYDQLVKAAKLGTVKVRVVKGSGGPAASVKEIYHP